MCGSRLRLSCEALTVAGVATIASVPPLDDFADDEQFDRLRRCWIGGAEMKNLAGAWRKADVQVRHAYRLGQPKLLCHATILIWRGREGLSMS